VVPLKSKRKLLRLLLLPALIPIFIIGWCMSHIGDNRRAKPKKQNKQINEDFVSFMPDILEEEQKTTH
jgi:hypothetical protein